MAENTELEQQLHLHMRGLIETQQIQGADYCVSVEFASEANYALQPRY